ncbi:hypothetical protein [Staphylococcus pseudoxylosus]|uniref:hypothetical protein n=1 Tax=Staphylococcus pseudoxylosus TaxID=2282419 RepID=UPI002DB80ECA|nr:hypothetical protein [Staphylococcus pseudoxylosus]MEB7752586.1 hypothetical protein [Staphylococcus pseudoxylosus]
MESFLKLLDWLLEKINFYLLLLLIIFVSLTLLIMSIYFDDVYLLLGWDFLIDKKGIISLILLISLVILIIKGVNDIVVGFISGFKKDRKIKELLDNDRIQTILINMYESRPNARPLNTSNEDVKYLMAYKLVVKTGGRGLLINGNLSEYSYPMLLTPKGIKLVENSLMKIT